MKKLFACLSLIVGLAGCNPIDAAFDCHAICGRYKDCFDGQYNLETCEGRCRDQSSTNTDYRHKADQCNACIDDRACASATFSCGSECSAIVP